VLPNQYSVLLRGARAHGESGHCSDGRAFNTSVLLDHMRHGTGALVRNRPLHQHGQVQMLLASHNVHAQRLSFQALLDTLLHLPR